ncbi:Predicted metal-dependent hydrolase, TIM-barrel fold [Bosea sp. 62]|uniref:amidohydrolase family protein n=1 Tax=unclassified Bosea (in: a-proteobacteria) TaxID=2653178 RepID=UPI0012599FF3|nr:MULTISPECIES: amidohydrolase family protein [unclassified Bosea (in: a-proteobacteria)]CAD5260759.1 Predicted metal-dependent hydrolase, TIM-barrel fold [Bosea sp. 46]CAD5265303.1 Predicted metal-dependent hydrolase, TIM-barrel fold [Bosea sp. 21B]CAD5275050.1 Predicted metal-dependent hydrolase, TIM-barrel fold [Bosea sp. 7B]VVT59195.1 Predicted metal-dependent hydrolase, TIM-barrel fold [Bosea sp. EC-HK365B]VXB73151.1 Predicted metal-dependent hydrolase, TIM-barrel fold [Bosea sp. 29B]
MTGAAPMRRRIDIHHHFIPPRYRELVGADAIGRTLVSGQAPTWSPQQSIEAMDRNGVSLAVVSISAPGFQCDEGERAALCCHCNDFAARMRSDHPSRFGSFASLPLPDIEASLKEIERAFDELEADGVGLLTNYEGRYLGDPLFDPIFEALNRRAATVFVHPTDTPCGCWVGLPAASLEFPFDTTRAIANLLFSGTIGRFPKIRMIFSHAGGTIPFLAGRLARLERRPDYKKMVPEGVKALLQTLYFDTALSAEPSMLNPLLALTTPEHVLFGSDYPYAPEDAMTAAVRSLDAMSLPNSATDAILAGNALGLLPSLGVRSGI